MRKYLVILLAILVPTSSHAQILFTEIMYDLSGADDGREWVEIYNDGPVYDLTNWKFFEEDTNHSLFHISGGSTLGTGEYAVIADDADLFLADHPGFQGKLFDSSFSLSNSGETLIVKFSSGDVIAAETAYSSSLGGAGDGYSLQYSGSEWLAATSTPGQAFNNSGGEIEPFVEPIVISGTISSDTIWSPDDGIYMLDSEVTVAASTTLTIEPGTVIKAKNGGGGVLKILGTLNAIGMDDNKITFTSILDDSVGGRTNETDVSAAARDWQGIYFKEGSIGNLENVVLRYGGYGGGGYGNSTDIENDGGSVIIGRVTLENGWSYGVRNISGTTTISNSVINGHNTNIYSEGGSVTVSDTEIGNALSYAVYAVDAGALNLNNNNFSSNQFTAFVEASVDFSHSGNLSFDMAGRGFEIVGYARNGSVWNSNDLPIIVKGAVTVLPGELLTISPGTIIKSGTNGQITVRGKLEATGTSDQKIVLTSLKNDTVAGDTNGDGSASLPNSGDWRGLIFEEGSEGGLENFVLYYAGEYSGLGSGPGRSGIYNLGGSITLDEAEFSNNYVNDIYQNSGSLTINDSDFLGNYDFLLVDGGLVSVVGSKFNISGTGINNRSASTTVEAVHNWWGVGSGPRTLSSATSSGAFALGSVNYDPWIKRDPALPNPVIIVPGMMGSSLINPDLIINNEKWPNLTSIIFSPDDSFLDEISLSLDGEPVFNLQPGEVVEEIGSQDFTKSLSILLTMNMGDVYHFPYDWRLDIRETASDTSNSITASLADKIDKIKSETGAEKVNIVAHSMGGLLVKEYLLREGGIHVDKFVDIATPHLGSPKTFKILNYGDDLGFLIQVEKLSLKYSVLNSQRVKSISQNMPAVYQLLPSRNYFDESNNDYKYYVFDGLNGNTRLSFDQTKEYMKSEGRNAVLVDRADEFHQEIDGLNPEDYGVETYNIVGCGTPTIGQFYILGKDDDHYNYNIKFINGDGTVPLKSAEALPAKETYYVKNVQHAVMPSAAGVKELISSILTEENFDTDNYPNIDITSAGCTVPNGKIVSFHSPVELHIYDSFGNHAGPSEDDDIENNIDEVVYEMVDDNSFAFIPNGQSYQITGESIGTGNFDVRIEDLENEEVIRTTIFSNIPLLETTSVNFDIGENTPSQIYLDENGDGNFESTVAISTTTTGFLESTGGEIAESSAEIAEELSLVVVTLGSSKPATPSLTKESLVEQERAQTIEQVFYHSNPDLYLETLSSSSDVIGASGTSSEPETIEDDASSNTAVAYKSLPQKVKSFFKFIWRWFISRL